MILVKTYQPQKKEKKEGRAIKEICTFGLEITYGQ